MLAIRLPKDIEDRLKALAAATGRTKTFHAREAIVGHLAELEHRYVAENRRVEVRDDPFGAFEEWNSAADRSGYAGF
ncbi:MAG TPA: TraY domain-containing protein [Caulobacteraceae bacterium]